MAGGPKGMPPKFLAKLRKAWKAAMDDPAWHAKAKKMKIPVAYVSGEKATGMAKKMYKDLKKIFATSPELKKTIKK